MTPEAWLNHEVSVGLRSFWLGNTSDETAIVVSLHNVTDVHKIKEVIASFDGIRYFDNLTTFALILETLSEKHYGLSHRGLRRYSCPAYLEISSARFHRYASAIFSQHALRWVFSVF